MRTLIAGAGAGGLVHGHLLARNGADVSYLVKPGQEGWAEDGMPIYRLRHAGGPVGERLVPSHVFTDAATAAGHGWDMVWLCVASTALGGRWMNELRDATGAAIVVSIGQDPGDRPTLERTWPADRIVRVAPTLLAHPTGLGGVSFPAPGMAYWVPPGTAARVSGDRARSVVHALRRGGMRARYTDKAGDGELTAALTMPYVAALEGAGWSLPALSSDVRLAAAAAREAADVVAALYGARAPRRFLTSPSVTRPALRVLPRLVPFDLPAYLQSHFTKVGAQTRQMLDRWIAEGDARAMSVVHLRELRGALTPAPGRTG